MLRIKTRCHSVRLSTPFTSIAQRRQQRCHLHRTATAGPNARVSMEHDEVKLRELIDAARLLCTQDANHRYHDLCNNQAYQPIEGSPPTQAELELVRAVGRQEWMKWRKRGGKNTDAHKPLLAEYFAQRLATHAVSRNARKKLKKDGIRFEDLPDVPSKPTPADEGLWLPPADQALSSFDTHNFGSAWDTPLPQPQPADAAAPLSSPASWGTLQQRLRSRNTAAASKSESAVHEVARPSNRSKPEGKARSSGKSRSKQDPAVAVKGASAEVLRFRQNDLTLPQGDIEGPEGIPRLAHNLDRTLFDPGVHVMQDLRSDVYNFDPYLSTIPPNSEFDFEALGEFVSASKDHRLRELVQEKKHKYCGSTSSLSSILSHFHYLLSGWRKLNYDNISRSWEPPSQNFTQLVRRPAASFAQFDAPSSTYALDADKEFDTETILSMLGKSMEKLLVLPKDQFERYHLDRSHEITEAERNAREGYNYTGFGQFLVRSQLDAHDPRLPGRGIFDIKTRAALGVRMNMDEPEMGQPYEIINHHGQWDSFEREYVDMIRSAFLKYSLQVRMGGMDGIFCAYHNTKRIFGFQYIPLEEMDERIHGSSWQPGNPTQSVGQRELQHSFAMLEALMEKATARFPNQTLRLHFETRETAEPLMYFFAEPVTSQQMQSIQEATKQSATESAERVIRRLEEMGNTTSAEASKKSKSVVWEELKEEIIASAQDGTEMLDDVALELMTKHGLLDNHTEDAIDESTQALAKLLLDAVRGDENGTRSNDGEDNEHEYETDTSVAAAIEYKDLEQDSADPMPETTSTGYEGNSVLPQGEAATGEDTSKDPGMDSEPSTITTQESVDEAASGGDGLAAQTEQSLAGMAVEGSKSEKSLTDSLEEALRGNIDNQKALQAFVSTFEELRANRGSVQPEEDAGEEISEDIEVDAQAQPEPAARESQLMGLAITVKHKVNGKRVERPEFPIDSWDIDCTIKELKPETARRIYKQLKGRRQASFRKNGSHERYWRQSIQDSTDRGAAFRANRELDEATQSGMKVAWADEQVPKNTSTSIFSTK